MRLRTLCCALVLLAAPAASTTPAFAGPNDLKVIGQQCTSQLKLAPAVCNCMVQKAGSELNGNQQAFMAAQLSGNTAEVARIQSTLTAAEAAATGQFMGSVAGACGG